MKKVRLFSVVIPFMLLFSCNGEQGTRDQTEKTIPTGSEDSPGLLAEEGLTMLKVHCNACHNPLAPSHDALLAPPMVAVKFRYKNLYPDREAFIEYMSDFMNEPTAEKAKMKNAVERFGVMAKTPLSKKEIIRLSAYIYDNKLEEPSWFAGHFEEEHGQKWVQ